MVLEVENFRVHPSFRKTLRKFGASAFCEIRIDSDFEQVIQACRISTRQGQTGTWIDADIMRAYIDLHHKGLAHSVETWVNSRLVGGLYCVALGHAVFGESMFSSATDASKIALAALVGFCRYHQIAQIDCQQNTRHLASLGAHEIKRSIFLQQVVAGLNQESPVWQFDPLFWDKLLPHSSVQTSSSAASALSCAGVTIL
jgi:leucyl/phenylalanyl-tRNA--protein transferase